MFLCTSHRSLEEEYAEWSGTNKVPDAKVVSIIGNTGEGKSYALNRTFFSQHEDEAEDDISAFHEVRVFVI